MIRLLVINPNTSTQVSQKIKTLVQDEVGQDVEIHVVTADFGFDYISTRCGVAIATHAVLDAAAKFIVDQFVPDAVLLACFGDPGREALEELTGLPVVGFAEGGLRAAAAEPGTTLVATSGSLWCTMLDELIQNLGIADKIAGVRSVEHVDGSNRSIAEFLTKSARALGASRILLGGAGLIDKIPEVMATSRLPVLDPHRTAIRKAVELASVARSRAAGLPNSPAPVGLSRSLCNLLEPQ
ncbi:aspartate/glutamate racemase family protein [Ensifer sp. 4252]|uniref:aspartate/glutamate racemase family protein n=1 Tax=Ensifer sp. 4252 TaxID=3373915 RepID=UPI003D211E47